MLTPAPTARPHDSIAHEMLALADHGACILRVVNDTADGRTAYQYRLRGRVVAEAPTLNRLIELLHDVDGGNLG